MTRGELCAILRKLRSDSCVRTEKSMPFILQFPIHKMGDIESGNINFTLSECLLYMNIWNGEMELSNIEIYDYMKTLEEVLYALTQFRLEAGMSISELSSASGVSYNTIKGYENGIRDIKIDTFIQIINALGCVLKIE